MTSFKRKKIYVAGHMGMVGSSILRMLQRKNFQNILVRTKKELNLLDQNKVYKFLLKEKPDYIFIAAAKVGGILANLNYSADFIFENLQIQNNLIYGAFNAGIKDLCFLGSSCIYPKLNNQAIQEESLLTGSLEKTNEPYAIAGIKLCESLNKQYKTNYLSLMPSNLYGPNDNFDLNNSHVLPALIRKIYEAKLYSKKSVKIWGTGKPRREFLYVDDLADACIFLMDKKITGNLLNIGSGRDITIYDLTKLIMQIVGYDAEIEYDMSKPDGTINKLLDITKLSKLGWFAKTSLEDGIKRVYDSYKKIK